MGQALALHSDDLDSITEWVPLALPGMILEHQRVLLQNKKAKPFLSKLFTFLRPVLKAHCASVLYLVTYLYH